MADKGTTLTDRLIGVLDTVVDNVNTKIGINTDAAGTTTLFARLKQIVDNYLEKGLLNGTGTVLPDNKSLYDYLLTTDNNYSTVTANWNAAAQTVFEIVIDTRYELIGISVDLTGTTNASTWTFQLHRAYAASGADYRNAGDAITRVVGTDSDVTEFSDLAHYGYVKLTAQSDAAGDDAKTIKFTRITKPLE